MTALASRRPLPATMIDLLRDGARGTNPSRSEIVKAVRSIMMSAQRRGRTYVDLQPEFLDTHRNHLARQLAEGAYAAQRLADGRHPGRSTSKAERDKFLRNLWDQTEKTTSATPTWTSEDALRFINAVREAMRDEDLSDDHHKVMEVVLELGKKHGTTQPAVPVHEVVTRTGLCYTTAWRRLKELCNEGKWLSLAHRGRSDPAQRRANIYKIAPALIGIHMGASPPVFHGPPAFHPPVFQSPEVETTAVGKLSDAQIAAVLADQASARETIPSAGEIVAIDELPTNVIPFKRRQGA